MKYIQLGMFATNAIAGIFLLTQDLVALSIAALVISSGWLGLYFLGRYKNANRG